MEIREGKTYESHIDATNGQQDIAEIPPPVKSPNFSNLPQNEFKKGKLVTFDIETTSGEKYAHMIQLSASHYGKEFNRYITTTKDISRKSESLTGITLSDGITRHHGKIVETVGPGIHEALTDFIKWLETMKPVILVAHNAKAFDSYHLIKCITLEWTS